MTVRIRLLGQLKNMLDLQPEFTADAGLSIREILELMQIRSELVAGVIVNGALQSKDYCVQDGDEVQLMAVMGGG